jgi:hypothetical protein
MILTDNQAIAIVKTNPNKQLISFLQGKYEVMRAQVTGIHAQRLIERMEGFERANVVEARKKLMLSNKDMITRLMKPRNKIYTAKGGIESYNLATAEQISEYKIYLSKCAGKRISLKEYIRQELQRAYDIDPMGLKWVGVNEDGNPYPTYKCIMNIFDYDICDGAPEYVVFVATKYEVNEYIESGIIPASQKEKANLKVYRCVCDGWDRIIMWADSKDPTIIAQIPNPFGKVPGEVVSDIVCEDENGYKYYESPLYPVSELLTQYMFGRSIYNIAFSSVAFPIMWMQAQVCPTCQGKKVLGIPQGGGVPTHITGEQKCPECKGTGVLPHWQNSDTYIWEFRLDKDGAVPRPPLGIIEPALESLRNMKEHNTSIEEESNITMWGITTVSPNSKMPDSKGKIGGSNTSETAFEANLNEEPKKDRQKEFTRWYSNSATWYINTIGELMYGDSFISCTFLGGDRYASESADEILTRVTKAKSAGAPQSILQSLYIEYLDSKYENNPLEWRKYWLMYLGEPYFFYQVSDVMTWLNIPQIQVLEKQLWGEFMCTLNDQIVASIPDDNALPVMQAMIRDFVVNKYLTDKKADALLFANDGSLIMIGDTAKVKTGKAEHLEKTYKVSNIANNTVTLQIGDSEYTDYMRSDLERIF